MWKLTCTSRVLLLLVACAVSFSIQVSAAEQQVTSAEEHDREVASIITCGPGVFEYEGINPSSRYDFSVRDGAQILVSLAHRVGWTRVSQLLGFGDDGAWLEKQFEPQSYDIKKGANTRITPAAYLLGQYARHYCVEHPFDTLADIIDNVARQAQAKKVP